MCILGGWEVGIPNADWEMRGYAHVRPALTTDIGVEQQILLVRKEHRQIARLFKNFLLQNTMTFPGLDKSICTFHDFPDYPMNVGTL